jgi:hypothetical protein
MRVVFASLLLLAGCGDPPYPAGHACHSSAECANGLICDYGANPPACAGMSSTYTDLGAAPTD